MTGNRIDVACLVVGPLATNCYIVSCPDTREALIIDPGGDADVIRAHIEKAGLTPTEVLSTHGHSDHIAKAAELCGGFGIGFAVHSDAREIITLSVKEAPLWGMGTIVEPEVGRIMSHGDAIRVGRTAGVVRHTPGHSPGGVSFVFENCVFAGDSLFAGSIGRTDLYGGDLQTLLESIRRELLPLADDTIAYCGHGPGTTIGRERADNPFLCGAF